MANPTTNFGWVMPTSSSLVTNLPADFNTFGQAVDTSMSELLGGTTDQVLAKNSNTDMDFKWVTSDDANAIQNAQLTAKGALITAFSAGSPATLTVGTNGQTLVANSSTSTGLEWQTPAATTPTYVGASVYATNVTTSFVQYADNILAFANENFDTDAFHDNATNNSRITIPTGKGGKYLITAWVRSDTSISDAFTPILFKNGSRLTGSGDGILYGGFLSSQSGLTQSTAPLAVWGTAVVALSAADYIQLAVNTRQVTFNCNHYAQFGATYLGA